MKFEEKWTGFRQVSIILQWILTSLDAMHCTTFISNSKFHESLSHMALWTRDSRCIEWHMAYSFKMYCILGRFAPTIVLVFTVSLDKPIWLFVGHYASPKLYGLKMNLPTPLFFSSHPSSISYSWPPSHPLTHCWQYLDRGDGPSPLGRLTNPSPNIQVVQCYPWGSIKGINTGNMFLQFFSRNNRKRRS